MFVKRESGCALACRHRSGTVVTDPHCRTGLEFDACGHAAACPDGAGRGFLMNQKSPLAVSGVRAVGDRQFNSVLMKGN
jgi:hypothetical protein